VRVSAVAVRFRLVQCVAADVKNTVVGKNKGKTNAGEGSKCWAREVLSKRWALFLWNKSEWVSQKNGFIPNDAVTACRQYYQTLSMQHCQTLSFILDVHALCHPWVYCCPLPLEPQPLVLCMSFSLSILSSVHLLLVYAHTRVCVCVWESVFVCERVCLYVCVFHARIYMYV